MNNIEQAIKHYKSLQKRYTTEHNGKHCEFTKTSIQALQEKAERDNPQPLTTIQVMRSDWVWIEDKINNRNGYAQINNCYNSAMLDGYEYHFKNYNKTWIAYRHKPNRKELDNQ